MPMTEPWIIVGKGPAGLLAASLLLEQGHRVVVVAKGQGSLPLWSGALDFYSWDTKQHPVKAPYDHADHLPGLSLNREQWQAGWEDWRRILQKVGVQTQVSPDRENLLSPTLSGVLVPRYLVPEWQYAVTDPEPVTVVSWDGILDLDLHLWAERYQQHTKMAAKTIQRPAPGVWTARWTPLHWAGYLDSESGRRWLADDMEAALDDTFDQCPVLVPQIIGIRHTEEILSDLRVRLGRPVKEIPLIAPCLGGVRIAERWQEYLLGHGVRFVADEVVGVDGFGVQLATGGALSGRVVLATGGVLGGGFRLQWDRTMINAATGQSIAWSGKPEDLSCIGVSDANSLWGVVGRSAGGWDGDRHGGAGQVLGTVLAWVNAMHEEVYCAAR